MDENTNLEALSEKVSLRDILSYKRKLNLIEKVFIILACFGAFPGALLICRLIPDLADEAVRGLSLHIWIAYIIIWLLTAVVQMLTSFGLKQFSLTKGILATTIYSFFSEYVYVGASALVLLIIKNETFAWFYIALFSAAAYALFLFIVRCVVCFLNKHQTKYMMIIGKKEDATEFVKKICKSGIKRYKIKYIFFEEDGAINQDFYARLKNCNTVILLNSVNAKLKERLILHLDSALNKDVYVDSSYLDILITSGAERNVGNRLTLVQNYLTIDLIERGVKRITDILISLVAIIICIPIWLIVPILIKLTSKGPVFYRQIRFTKNLKEFKIFKFRSMYIDADPNKAALKGDERITKVGKLLRASRIDEIPQLFNILKGDMSIVGPRALMHGDVDDRLKEMPEFRYRFNVKAGLTGLQQVRTNSGTPWNEKLKYDLYYISHHSLALDIKIIFLTIKTVLKADTATGIDEDDSTLNEFLSKEGLVYSDHGNYLHIHQD